MALNISRRIEKLEAQVITPEPDNGRFKADGRYNIDYAWGDPKFRDALVKLAKNLPKNQWEVFATDSENLHRFINNPQYAYDRELTWHPVSKMTEACAHLLVDYLAGNFNGRLVMPDEAVAEQPGSFALTAFRCASCRYPVWAGADGLPLLVTCPACKRKVTSQERRGAVNARYTHQDMLYGFLMFYGHWRHDRLHESMREDHLAVFWEEHERREAFIKASIEAPFGNRPHQLEPPSNLILELDFLFYFAHGREGRLFPPCLPPEVVEAWFENGITDASPSITGNLDECTACGYPVPRRADRTRIFEVCPICSGILQDFKPQSWRRHHIYG